MQGARVELTRQVTPDVVSGLRLYGRLTGELTPDNEDRRIASWKYWFDENPEGPGFFAVAKDGDRVVGFRSLIPVAMRITGQRVLGGKGEFFAVDPDYRRSVVASTKQSVPITLQIRLRDWAYQQGLEAHFGVGTPTAAAVAMLTGGRLLEFLCARCTFPLGTLTREPAAYGPHQRLMRFASIGISPSLRRWAQIRGRRYRHVRLEEFTTFAEGDCESRHDLNQLFAIDPESLNFRFPDERFVKLCATSMTDDRQSKMVYSAVTQGADVRLLYWSQDLSKSLDLLCRAVGEMIRRGARARAARLNLALPVENLELLAALRKLGFRQRPGSESVVIHFRDSQNYSELVPQRWAFNLLHRHFYQDH